MQPGWPVDPDVLDRARAFVTSCSGPVVVASHNDVDGLTAALILVRALRARGLVVHSVPARRGEHVHRDGMRDRIRAFAPRTLVVVDMGSRSGRILEDVPTLVLDHHVPSGRPDGALLVNGYDRDPVASSSVLAHVVCQGMPGGDTTWLAALGAVADLGTAEPFEPVLGLRTRGAAWSKAVSLLNAARRAPEDDAETALEVLDRASGVHDIAAGRVEGVARLEDYRRAVQAEVDRCSRVAPQVFGDAALLRFSSGAQVHPLIATRWSQRLAPKVVIAANEGFIPRRVNFAARSRSDIDLLEWLRNLPFTPSPDAEYANGHPRATGGSLPHEEFALFVEALRTSRGSKVSVGLPRPQSAR